MEDVMRKNLAIVSCVAAVSASVLGARAQATLLDYQPYDYTQSTSLADADGGTGWSGPWNGGMYDTAHGVVVAPIGSVGGNAVEGNAAQGQDYGTFGQRSFSASYDTGVNYASGGPGIPYYFSFLVDFGTETSSTDVEGSIAAGFLTGGNLVDFNFGLASADTVDMSIAADPSHTVPLQTGTTYLIAGSFNTTYPSGPYSGEGQLDVSVYSASSSIPSSAPSSWDLSFTDSGNSAYNSVALTGFTVPYSQYNGDLSLDEIRVGTTFGDVAAPASVPEPTCLGLTCLAAGLLLQRRRVKGVRA
jgi:hypothetical protein